MTPADPKPPRVGNPPRCAKCNGPIQAVDIEQKQQVAARLYPGREVPPPKVCSPCVWSRRENILATAQDLMSDFLYYDRKEDEDLPRGAIEEAIEAGEVTVDELLGIFRAALHKSVTPERSDGE